MINYEITTFGKLFENTLFLGKITTHYPITATLLLQSLILLLLIYIMIKSLNIPLSSQYLTIFSKFSLSFSISEILQVCCYRSPLAYGSSQTARPSAWIARSSKMAGNSGWNMSIAPWNAPTEGGLNFTSDLRQQRYQTLEERKVVNTKRMCLNSTMAMNIFKEVRILLANIHIWGLAEKIDL